MMKAGPTTPPHTSLPWPLCPPRLAFLGTTVADLPQNTVAESCAVVQAFMIGSNTSLPALASFSIYAAIGLLFDLILQVRLPAAFQAHTCSRSNMRGCARLVHHPCWWLWWPHAWVCALRAACGLGRSAGARGPHPQMPGTVLPMPDAVLRR